MSSHNDNDQMMDCSGAGNCNDDNEGNGENSDTDKEGDVVVVEGSTLGSQGSLTGGGFTLPAVFQCGACKSQICKITFSSLPRSSGKKEQRYNNNVLGM